jgi:hypothetical protein
MGDMLARCILCRARNMQALQHRMYYLCSPKPCRCMHAKNRFAIGDHTCNPPSTTTIKNQPLKQEYAR